MEIKKSMARMNTSEAMELMRRPFMVTLSTEEIVSGALKGIIRAESLLNLGGQKTPRWGYNIEMALAELAICKGIERNVHPSGYINFDSGVAIGVNGRLRMIPVLSGDHDSNMVVKPVVNDAIYVHVIVGTPEYTITGWAWGKDFGKDKSIPQESLRPILELYRATH
jgi:hypothetical protein